MSIYKITTILILGIHLKYKFVISNTKRKQNIVWYLKYRPSSHGFNNLIIKAQNAC
jgi:hypothetical protein